MATKFNKGEIYHSNNIDLPNLQYVGVYYVDECLYYVFIDTLQIDAYFSCISTDGVKSINDL